MQMAAIEEKVDFVLLLADYVDVFLLLRDGQACLQLKCLFF